MISTCSLTCSCNWCPLPLQVGKPTSDYENDSEGKPESKVSKVVRGGAKMASKVTKLVVKESGKYIILWSTSTDKHIYHETETTICLAEFPYTYQFRDRY